MSKPPPKGYSCGTCTKWHDFPLYVYAHSRDVLKHECDNCGARHNIVMMYATQTKKGKPPRLVLRPSPRGVQVRYCLIADFKESCNARIKS